MLHYFVWHPNAALPNEIPPVTGIRQATRRD